MNFLESAIKKEENKLYFFQIWINNMRGLTAAGARSNSQKQELSEELTKKYPDYKYLGNGWHVFMNVSLEDVEKMKRLAEISHRSYTYKEYEANSQELYNFLTEYNYLHEFKCKLPHLVQNIDYPIDAPEGYVNGMVKYLEDEKGANRVIVAEKDGRKHVWSYRLTGYEKTPDDYYLYQNQDGEWMHWDNKKTERPVFI